MARMRFANALVIRLLESPLHRLLSSSVAVVTYIAADGRRIRLPVNYVQTGEVVVVVPGQAQHKTWWRHFRGASAAQLLVRGKLLYGVGEVVDGAGATVGLALYLRRFPQARRTLGVSYSSGRPNPVELRAATRLQPVVVFDLSAHPRVELGTAGTELRWTTAGV